VHERFGHSFSQLPQIRRFLRIFGDASVEHGSVAHHAFEKSFQFFEIVSRIRPVRFNHHRERTFVDWRRQFQVVAQTDETAFVDELESGKNFAEILSRAGE
jgi:hypothetical protein